MSCQHTGPIQHGTGPQDQSRCMSCGETVYKIDGRWWTEVEKLRRDLVLSERGYADIRRTVDELRGQINRLVEEKLQLEQQRDSAFRLEKEAQQQITKTREQIEYHKNMAVEYRSKLNESRRRCDRLEGCVIRSNPMLECNRVMIGPGRIIHPRQQTPTPEQVALALKLLEIDDGDEIREDAMAVLKRALS